MRRVGLDKQSVWILNSRSIDLDSILSPAKDASIVEPRRYQDTMETTRQEQGIIIDAIYSYRRRLLPVPHNAIPSNQGSILFETFLWKRRGCHPPIDVSKRLNAIASPHLEKVWGKRTVGWEWPHPPRSERWFNSFWQRCLTPPNWISAPPVISSLN